MWYVTAKPYRVSVLRIGVRDPGGAEWSHRPRFRKAQCYVVFNTTYDMLLCSSTSIKWVLLL
jgi:hypothetical protein